MKKFDLFSTREYRFSRVRCAFGALQALATDDKMVPMCCAMSIVQDLGGGKIRSVAIDPAISVAQVGNPMLKTIAQKPSPANLRAPHYRRDLAIAGSLSCSSGVRFASRFRRSATPEERLARSLRLRAGTWRYMSPVLSRRLRCFQRSKAFAFASSSVRRIGRFSAMLGVWGLAGGGVRLGPSNCRSRARNRSGKRLQVWSSAMGD